MPILLKQLDIEGDCAYVIFVLKADLNKLKYEDGQEEKLVTVKRQLTKEIEALREQTQNLEAR